MHIVGLLTSPSTDKPLLLAAIDAVPSIRRHEAARILGDLLDSGDEDIIAVREALAMANGLSEDAGGNDDDEENE